MKKLIASVIALLVGACPAFANTIYFEGFEAGSDALIRTSQGSVSYQNGTALSGVYSLRVANTSSATMYAGFTKLAAGGTHQSQTTGIGSTSFVKFDFQYHTKPIVTPTEFMGCYNGTSSASTDMLVLKLTLAGTIAVYNSTGALVTTGVTVLSADTKYRIDVNCTDGAAGAYEVKINGVSEVSGTTNQDVAGFVGIITFGQGQTDVGAETVDYFYDDIVINDATYTSYPKITALYAIANGGTAQWTSGTNSSDFAEVDDPAGASDVDTTYIKNPAAGGEVHLVSFQSTTTGGITGAIGAVKGLARIREDTSVTSSSYMRLKSSGTNSDTTGTNRSTAYGTLGIMTATDPNTATAWTSGGVDAVQVGVIETNAVADRCTRIMLEIMWDGTTPPTATATITPQPTKTPIWARNPGGNQIGGHKITHHGSIWE